jgi:iron(II)-dependent oxidoreductase
MSRPFLFSILLVACNGMSAPAPPSAKTQPAAAPKRAKPAVKTSPEPSAKPAPAPAPTPKADVPEDMLPVPGGSFTMGSDKGGERDEEPAHQVTIKGFLLDKTEVTNAAYLECVAAKVCRPYRDDVAKAMKYGSEAAFRGGKQPVVGVSWNDAKAYCEWRGKRLPTEAEFERAARGDDGRTYVWGNEPPDSKRHGVFSSGATEDVGSRPGGVGPYGHHDLAGNVWEWIADHYDPYAYKRSTAGQGAPGSCDQILKTQDELRETGQQGYTGTNPIPNECERVLRGGAFNYHPKGLRASNRVHHPGGWRLLVAGFRCAKDA